MENIIYVFSASKVLIFYPHPNESLLTLTHNPNLNHQPNPRTESSLERIQLSV